MPILKTITNDQTKVSATVYRVTDLHISFKRDGTTETIVTVQGFVDGQALAMVHPYQFKPAVVPAGILDWVENRVVNAPAFVGGTIVPESSL